MADILIEKISKSYVGKHGKVSVLENLSLQLSSGQSYAIVGPSGCGKSTLLMLAGGLLEQDEGKITLDGVDLLSLKGSERALKQSQLVGFVFQKFHLIPYLSVEENIQLSCLSRPIEGASQRCEKLMAQLGLEHRCRHLPSELSSGEQQRVALGRALMNQPKVLIADEPTGNLDHDNSELMMNLLNEFSKSGGTVLMATHDQHIAAMADQVLPFSNKGFGSNL